MITRKTVYHCDFCGFDDEQPIDPAQVPPSRMPTGWVYPGYSVYVDPLAPKSTSRWWCAPTDDWWDSHSAGKGEMPLMCPSCYTATAQFFKSLNKNKTTQPKRRKFSIESETKIEDE